MCSTPLDFYLRGRIGANIGDPQHLAIEGTLLIEFPLFLFRENGPILIVRWNRSVNKEDEISRFIFFNKRSE